VATILSFDVFADNDCGTDQVCFDAVRQRHRGGSIVRMGFKKLPLLPARHTMQMMAKAAVAVYEAVADKDQRKSQEQP